MKKEKREGSSLDQQKKFAPLAPDFVLEVRSESDSLKELQDKMGEWIEDGCRHAWLIDPVEQKASVYTAKGLVKTPETFNATLSGDDVLPGFALDLSLLK